MNESHLDQYIGNYRLLHMLNESKAGAIYLAEHNVFRTKAAIKLLDRRRAGDDIAKFLAQAELLTHLQHPHVVQVLDFGMIAETAFLIMNYAPNGTVRQRYPKGVCLPLSTILHYVQHLASALQYIHQHQLIHRDIKPHNMLLGTDDNVMLTDFGIAMVAQSFDGTSPAFRDFEGTAPYAAPEQLQGKPSRSSDLYALGVVVYEWLCGDWPFTGSFEEIAHQHLFSSPPSFTEKGVEVPQAIEQVIRKALAKEPEQRFSSAKDFALVLEQAYQTTQHPPTISEHLLKLLPKRQFMPPLPFSSKAHMKQIG